MEPTALDPVPDRTSTNVGGQQLPPRDHPMLTLGQLGDSLVDPRHSKLRPYGGANLELLGHAMEVGGQRRNGCAWGVAGLQQCRASIAPRP